MTATLQPGELSEALSARILLSEREVDDAESHARSLGLAVAPLRAKYWDNVLALQTVRSLAAEPVVDLGCRTGAILTWLDQLGFRRLYGCDLRHPWPPVKRWVRGRNLRSAYAGAAMWLRHGSRMRRAAVEETGFPDDYFAAATCMSVIEHGVDVDAFFREVERILRPGGILAMSTDYWPERIDGPVSTHWNNRPDIVFDETGMQKLVTSAQSAGLEAPILDLKTQQRVVHWAGRAYTFAYLEFRKPFR